MKEEIQMTMKAREHDVSDVTPEAVKESTTGLYQKIEDAVVGGYKAIENGVVNGYKAIENGVVDGFGKVTDKCVEVLFAKEGESVEDAKKRLSGQKDEV